MSFNHKMTIVIRSDLGMSAGKMIVQACHAAVEANERAKKENYKAWRRWKSEGGKKVALECESLEELRGLERRAERLGILAVIIKDAGHTEVPPGTITTLAIGPDSEDKVDRITGNLPLI